MFFCFAKHQTSNTVYGFAAANYLDKSTRPFATAEEEEPNMLLIRSPLNEAVVDKKYYLKHSKLIDAFQWTLASASSIRAFNLQRLEAPKSFLCAVDDKGVFTTFTTFSGLFVGEYVTLGPDDDDAIIIYPMREVPGHMPSNPPFLNSPSTRVCKSSYHHYADIVNNTYYLNCTNERWIKPGHNLSEPFHRLDSFKVLQTSASKPFALIAFSDEIQTMNLDTELATGHSIVSGPSTVNIPETFGAAPKTPDDFDPVQNSGEFNKGKDKNIVLLACLVGAGVLL
ncbi:hypothetical protein BCR41DRAFT_418486 [Lobosporangium transversale]|uniref:Uncharacterized protein n=1 Tax=Lobosporangium transversale TaxID=64571 RepID=A0A1Y2H1J9_9FUNG|nr:hypothetical protein BCR41DRAFT_418486 [Lobosporangium transversale]ORZ28405.1 hypothetical protein BCR41DRAFT_418486 [Lobosporangium transversale]|eukprot:XP_021886090.1 hypothetical protein BCR41DRAFT_418486 [Lobosporangium transversale]